MKKILVVTIVIVTGLLAGSRSVAQTTKNAVPVRTTDPAPRVTKVQATAPMKGGGAVAGGATTVTGGQGAKAVRGATGVTGVTGTVPGGSQAAGAQKAPVKEGAAATGRTTTAVTKAGGSTSGATATTRAPIKAAASGSNANAQ
jgi:hypothetical protein